MKRGVLAAGLSLFLLSAVLRFYGLDHGLPYNYIPDTTIVRAAMSLGAGANPFAGDFLPTQYPYFLPYLLYCIYGMMFVFGFVFRIFISLSDFREFAFQNPQFFFLTARFLSAFAGCLLVLVTAWIGRRIMNPMAGWFSGLFTATSLIMVQLSHQARPHVVAVLMVMLVVLFAVRWMQEKRASFYVLSWVAAGLSVSTVPYGAFSVLIPVAGLLMARDCSKKWRLIFIGPISFLLISWFFYPHALAGFRDAFSIDEATDVVSYYKGMHVDLDFINGKGFMKLLGWLILYEPVLSIMALLGALKGPGIFRNRQFALLSIVYPAVFFIIYGSYEVIHPRYILSLIPFLSFPAGFFASRVVDRVSRSFSRVNSNRKFNLILSTFCGIIIFLHPTLQALRFDVLSSRDDTRQLATTWIKANFDNAKRLAVEPHGVFLQPDRETLIGIKNRFGDKIGAKDRYLLSLPHDRYPLDCFPIERLWYRKNYQGLTLDQILAEAPVEYVIAVIIKRERSDLFYESLKRKGRLLKRFSPYVKEKQWTEAALPTELQNPLTGLWQVVRCGPVVEIFEVRYDE